jgi:hypothetical protein
LLQQPRPSGSGRRGASSPFFVPAGPGRPDQQKGENVQPTPGNPADRVWELIQEIRDLPAAYKSFSQFELAEAGGGRIYEAIEALRRGGACKDAKFRELWLLIDRQKQKYPDTWQSGAFKNTVCVFFPDLDRRGLVGYAVPACAVIADLLAAEAARIGWAEPKKARSTKPRTEKPGRGRHLETDPKADKQVSDAWKTHQYKTYADCGQALGKSERETYLAIERHRGRLKRKSRKRK